MLEKDEIYLAHKKLGFPAFEDKEQARMILTHDWTPISNLIPELCDKPIHWKMLKYYLTIRKENFKYFFNNSNYITDNMTMYKLHPQQDGQWIKQSLNEKYEIICQERGGIHHVFFFSDKNELTDYLIDKIYRQLDLK